MNYPSIRIEGAILSPDVLDNLEDKSGQKPRDFGFDPSIKIKDEIARAWADANDYWRIFQRKIEKLGPSGNSVGNAFKLTSGKDRVHRRKNRSPS